MTKQRQHAQVPAPEVTKLESLKQLNLNAAGLDIGAAEIWGCVPEGRAEQTVRRFETFTTDLYALANWLKACQIDTVAMESTGVYWIPIYEILTEGGFEVYLVNARHIKNVPGKKSDVLDCQWIQQLHTYGLLQASFRPTEEMCALRAYIRHRDNLIRHRSSHVQHMQKALHLMNVQLTNVISDITGHTGMQIIRAIITGQHDPIQLARYRDPRCASSEEEIAKALTGNYRPEHLFPLKQAVELYDFYNHQIAACDIEIERKYAAIKPAFPVATEPLPSRKQSRRSKNEPKFDLRSDLYRLCGVDLTQIDGLDALTVQQIISETGVDMQRWPTVKHFTSWLTLAPHNDISGGKVLRSRTLKSTNRAAQAFRMAAQSVGRSKSALGAFYRRMRAKHGAPKALTATAHKLARIFYHMLKYREQYNDPGQDYYEERYRTRVIQNLHRRARELGMELVPISDVS
ncbi:MAG: IS110 family transposase [Caldilinea sp.]